jgi:hypothetical protein
MEASSFDGLGHALKVVLTMHADGSRSGSLAATTPVAVLGILALTGLGMAFLQTQKLHIQCGTAGYRALWRPCDAQPELADGDGKPSHA